MRNFLIGALMIALGSGAAGAQPALARASFSMWAR